MSLGLLGSCLRSSVSVSPKVVVLLGPGLLALLLMLCVPGWNPKGLLKLRVVLGSGVTPLPLSRMLLSTLLVKTRIPSLVLPVMLVGKVGGLGFSKNGVLLGVTRLLLFLSSLLRSFAPFVLMTCALGCSLLRLLLLLVLVALFLPATWSRVRVPKASSLCPWGCQSQGFWDHIAWSCDLRPSHGPAKPSCTFLARLGWSLQNQNLSLTEVTKVRCWLAECQLKIWSTKEQEAH